MNGLLHDNMPKQRFEIEFDGQIVFADYVKEGSKLKILHVETPASLRGRGAASALMAAIAAKAATEGLQIHPICGYAAAWLARHPQG